MAGRKPQHLRSRACEWCLPQEAEADLRPNQREQCGD